MLALILSIGFESSIEREGCRSIPIDVDIDIEIQIRRIVAHERVERVGAGTLFEQALLLLKVVG